MIRGAKKEVDNTWVHTMMDGKMLTFDLAGIRSENLADCIFTERILGGVELVVNILSLFVHSTAIKM